MVRGVFALFNALLTDMLVAELCVCLEICYDIYTRNKPSVPGEV